MTHTAARMLRVKDQTESFGQIITGIDNSWDVLHDKLFPGLPFLNGEIMDFNMTGTRGVFVDYCNGCFIVNVVLGHYLSSQWNKLGSLKNVMNVCHGHWLFTLLQNRRKRFSPLTSHRSNVRLIKIMLTSEILYNFSLPMHKLKIASVLMFTISSWLHTPAGTGPSRAHMCELSLVVFWNVTVRATHTKEGAVSATKGRIGVTCFGVVAVATTAVLWQLHLVVHHANRGPVF